MQMPPQRFRALIVLLSTSAILIILHIFSSIHQLDETQVYGVVNDRPITTGDSNVIPQPDAASRLLSRLVDQSQQAFVLNTSKCYVPSFDPQDPAMANYFMKPLITCEAGGVKFLFKTQVVRNQTCPIIDDDAVAQQYPKLIADSLKCSYVSLLRDESSDRPDASFTQSEEKHYAIGSCPPEEHIWLTCSDQYDRVYEQPLLLPKARPARARSGSGQIANVLVLGIDALSRLNFLRQMNRTRRWLEARYGIIEMFGYNKIGENSAPNQIPMMTGVSYIPGLMDRAIGNYFDDLTEYIWDYYKKRGFGTMFFEEQWQAGLFIHPSMRGFRNVPTDYYPRPLFQMVDKNTLKKVAGRGLCVGGYYAEKMYLQYLVDSLELTKHSNPLFAYAWFSELSHDQLNGARRADDDFFEFFELLEHKGLLEETVILFLSDHGSRLEEWRGTTVGRYEDMMPFFYIMLPPKIIKARPDAVDKLLLNSHRLITVYDIHATLQELATPWSARFETKRSLGSSLISREIPENRTCLSAGINLQFCSCLRPARIDIHAPLARDFADFVIRTANEELVKNNVTSLCQTWTFESIYDVFQLEDPDKQFQIYKILLYAQPNKATFEASAKYRDGKFELLSRIERLDWYSSHAGCVEGKTYARYCYCAW